MDLSRVMMIVRSLGLFAFFMLAPITTWAADTGEGDFAKGWDLLKIKKYKEARMALETGLRKNPSNALAQFYLADACRAMKEWSCAEEHYRTSLELDPQSNVSELARLRLHKATTWRLIEEAKRSLTDPNVSSTNIQQATDALAVAGKMGIDAEQQAISDKLHADGAAKKYKADAKHLLPKLEGRWKYVGSNAIYRSMVNNDGTLDLQLEQPTKYLQDAGIKAGILRFQRGKVISLHETQLPAIAHSVINRDNSTGQLFAKGEYIPFAEFAKGQGCRWEVSTKSVSALLVYTSDNDNIRIIPFQELRRTFSCEIITADLNHISSSEVKEMVRVSPFSTSP